MKTRNILDTFGNIIGTLTLPDCTTEEQWNIALSSYLTPMPVVNKAVEVQTTLNNIKTAALLKDYSELTILEKKIIFNIPVTDEEILNG